MFQFRISGPKKDKITGGWTRLHNKQLRKLYYAPSIKRMTNSKRIRWAGNVGRMGKRGKHIGYWKESQKEIDQ
jgi:hypothetical protein